MSAKITPDHLGRSAVVYVRQSTMSQVMGNLESQRRQYDLAGAAQSAGFAAVTVIDDDLGRSGSGSVHRPGFERLVAMVCSGNVGAVYCIEASRLARNGRDWHHLIDLCALAGALVIDPDGAYDPRLVNDRLLLGLKGTMSEYELSLLRQRGIAARDSKARRGEYRCVWKQSSASTSCSTSSDINGQSADQRRAVRQQLSAPLVADLHIWMSEGRRRLSGGNDVARAMDYMLKRWAVFAQFLNDGRICLTNNAAERGLRGIALGRKLWLFAGSDRGGQRAAIMYSLIVSAKLNNIDPQA